MVVAPAKATPSELEIPIVLLPGRVDAFLHPQGPEQAECVAEIEPKMVVRICGCPRAARYKARGEQSQAAQHQSDERGRPDEPNVRQGSTLPNYLQLQREA